MTSPAESTISNLYPRLPRSKAALAWPVDHESGRDQFAQGMTMENLEFNVSYLLRRAVGATARSRIDTNEPVKFDELSTTRIWGDVELIRTDFGILARARLQANAQLGCDRCLDPYEATLQVEFAEEYLPVIDVSTGRPVQSERTDETFFISPTHVVDATEAMRQYLLLATPMHRVCQKHCLGLCPVCGVNRNTNECECAEADLSPFSALAVLLRHR